LPLIRKDRDCLKKNSKGQIFGIEEIWTPMLRIHLLTIYNVQGCAAMLALILTQIPKSTVENCDITHTTACGSSQTPLSPTRYFLFLLFYVWHRC
jgi:hypothetical protein